MFNNFDIDSRLRISPKSFPDFFETITPITKDRIKKAKMISQSMFSNCMLKVYLSEKLIG